MSNEHYNWIITTVMVEERTPGTLHIMNASEAAKYLGVARQTLMRHLWDGDIPHFRVGKDYRFVKELLDAWMQSKVT